MRSVERIPRSGPRPPILLRPAPAFEPPFDDEIEPHVWAMAHQLAFDLDGLPRRNESGQHDSGLGNWGQGTPSQRRPQQDESGQDKLPQDHSPQDESGQDESEHRTAQQCPPAQGVPQHGRPEAAVAGASAEARLAVRRFVVMCAEVLNGYRPAAHLRTLSLPRHAAGVVAQAMAANHRVAELRRSHGGRATRGTSRHGRRPDPVAIRGLRLCEPRPGAVEAAVLLVTGERTWAVALRLERHQQSWSATTLRLV